ncbi:MAG: hypothetical protein AB7N29_11410 [Vicinamibacterales bacterium]
MSPKSFTFKLTVPRDPQLAAIVADVATHAAGYAELEAAAGADFVARVSAAAATALAAPGPALLVVATSDGAALTFTLDADIVSVAHAA